MSIVIVMHLQQCAIINTSTSVALNCNCATFPDKYEPAGRRHPVSPPATSKIH